MTLFYIFKSFQMQCDWGRYILNYQNYYIPQLKQSPSHVTCVLHAMMIVCNFQIFEVADLWIPSAKGILSVGYCDIQEVVSHEPLTWSCSYQEACPPQTWTYRLLMLCVQGQLFDAFIDSQTSASRKWTNRKLPGSVPSWRKWPCKWNPYKWLPCLFLFRRLSRLYFSRV